MDSRELTGQRLVRRSTSVTRPFAVLLWTTGTLLIAEILRANLPSAWRDDWPWKVQLLGIPTTAALFTAAILAWITRDQYARSVTPLLRYVSRWVARADRVESQAERYRQVLIRNAGPGTAVIAWVRWRVATNADPVVVDVPAMPALREVMAGLGLRDAVDYVISNYSAGTALAPNEERLYFECTDGALGNFLVLDAIFVFESLPGDRLEKRISLLPHEGASAAVDSSSSAAA